jgi:hypothetical protein
MYELSELHREVAAVAPILGVSGAQGNVRVDYAASATAGQIAAGDAVVAGFDWANADRNWLRATADQLATSDPAASSKLARAVVLVTLDEINLLRDFDAQLKAAVAAATSLANLQTRVAAISTNLTARTKAQLLSAIQSKIDAGDAD